VGIYVFVGVALMESLFLPILLFVVAGTLLGVGLLTVGSLIGPSRNTNVKEMPYESGMDPIHDTHRRFDVRFHLVAICFLIFDVELMFLYPWAVASRSPQGIDQAVQTATELGVSGFSRGLVFAEVMIFLSLLAAGVVYAWRKGVFQWR
jgi:NADH-quinone oxidoreductase subunit A